jgi:hypothetical protein
MPLPHQCRIGIGTLHADFSIAFALLLTACNDPLSTHNDQKNPRERKTVVRSALFNNASIMLALTAAFSLNYHAQQETTLPAVEVIGNMPLPSMCQPRNEIAAPVQSASSRDVERSGALDLGDFLYRRLGSVHVNEMQGNPFQMDVNYGGYTASPLLGTPQACLCTWTACA